MTNKELKPCPFCGGDVSFHKDDECDGCHYIHCQGCDAMFDFATTADPENVRETMDDLREAIAPVWNRRALDAICVELPFETYGCMEGDKVKEALTVAGVSYK